ncbi:erythromycin esterase family protein [Virgisporangium aurantiacum]|uniref:Erythromycin esterase n=1 Tax=Virgisporangium aurantiacum TaxID=175570 RepID=A0A8J3ZG14_9ACTN|nr:erythromycin esterase family protein [Virgisporangium aurantiacum]GIJ63211.1 hypothetical protein Vau01_107270 [Virgisporangium aurantiacum]
MPTPSRRTVLRATAATAGALTGAWTGAAGAAVPADRQVSAWIERNARPVTGRSIDAMLRNAVVVGLGESTNGAHEHLVLNHDLVRHLVEKRGFRAIALEEDWTMGIQIDRYVRHGDGDPRALLPDAGLPWRTVEMLDLIRWMRAFNVAHPNDPVAFLGADVVAVRALAYDAVTEHVRRYAPGRLAELGRHYAVIRPPDDITAHIAYYRSQPDKQPFLDHARRALHLVADLPGDRAAALALQHSRAILGFYEYHASGEVAIRDRAMAQTVAFWRRHTGNRIAYWASNVHIAVGRPLTISYPPFPAATQHTAGGLLRTRYGHGYLPVGAGFRTGVIRTGFPPAQYTVPPPSASFADAAFTLDSPDPYLVDLRADAPPAVRRWLHTPARMRAIGPAYDPLADSAYHMSGAGPADWFDALLRIDRVTAPQPV